MLCKIKILDTATMSEKPCRINEEEDIVHDSIEDEEIVEYDNKNTDEINRNSSSSSPNINDDDEDVNLDNDDGKNEHYNFGDCQLQNAIRCNKSSSSNILNLIKLFPMKVKHMDEFGSYPLHCACHMGYEDVAIKLIEIFPEAAQYPCSLMAYPLHLACRSHLSEDLVMKIIQIYPEAVHKMTMFGTALHSACDNNMQYENVIVKLIEMNPVALQEQDKDGRLPIQRAIIANQPVPVFKLLLDSDPLGLQRGGRSRHIDNVTPLHLACDTDNIDLIQYFMQRSDLLINVRDRHGSTPLHYACVELREKNVKILLQHPDVDVNATNSWNETPLHQTVSSYQNDDQVENCVNIVQMLLDHPFLVTINQKDRFHDTTPMDTNKRRIDDLEEFNDPKDVHFVEGRKKIRYMLNEFPIKRRWQSYCYHFESF